ncbi:homoserine O-acetyltransferase [Bdellovibrio bacteriovorus W]|nr:homoserine O-acetyltransferase [Bdellovibrio bacteriovorus W]
MKLQPTLRLPTHSLPQGPFWLKEKKTFSISGFKTLEGKALPDFELGYETYGNLNEKKDNVILVCHYFSGSSNAAGKYAASDMEPGYWDALIGPGKSVDTEKYFVVAVDILCNVCPALPMVKTVGPSSLNPSTGSAFGMDFPQITIADMVRAQKLVLDSLGVEKLHAVLGPSLGSMQAWQWAADYPEMVERIVPVIGSGFETSNFVAAAVELWARMLKLDPMWSEGRYTSATFPMAGMVSSLEMLTWNCLSPQWTEVYGFKALHQLASQRAQFIDPNHFLYIVHAVQTFSVREKLKDIRAKALVIAAESDFLMLPEFSKQAVQECEAQGIAAEYFEIKGQGGHLDGLFAIEQVGARIANFLGAQN